MEFLLIVVVIGFLAMAANSIEAKAKAQQKELIKEISKVCPPHKWFYQEIKDHEGVTHAWKMVCEHCGPLKPIDQPRKMDY